MTRGTSHTHLVAVGGALLLALAPRPIQAQAVTVGGGVGMLGVSAEGYVGQVALSYDAALRGRSRWWASVHAGRDPNPGVASPGIEQAVTEVVVALGPMLPVRGPGPSTFFIGGGLYGVARSYGEAYEPATGRRWRGGNWIPGGGDWGVVGRTALHLGRSERVGVVLDAQWRYAYEGSVRRLQPAFSLGFRRTW